jgi:hypothetical protein
LVEIRASFKTTVGKEGLVEDDVTEDWVLANMVTAAVRIRIAEEEPLEAEFGFGLRVIEGFVVFTAVLTFLKGGNTRSSPSLHEKDSRRIKSCINYTECRSRLD